MWASHRAVLYPVTVDPDDGMDEYLDYPVPARDKPIELYDFGDVNQSVSSQSIQLSGKAKLLRSGYDSIMITNHRLPSAQVEANRIEYDNWNASSPLFLGVKQLTLIARDLRGYESTMVVNVTREE